MLNKKEAELIMQIGQCLTELAATGKIANAGMVQNLQIKPNAGPVSPLRGMNESSRNLFAALQAKYGGKVITVMDNEHLRKAMFDNRVQGLFPFVKSLEKRGLCVYEVDKKYSKPRLVSFILKEKI